jgi:hypothetical protein
MLALAVAFASVATGCGGSDADVEIGVRRVGVDLAFQADKDIDKKLPKVEVVYIDAPPPLPSPVLVRNPQQQIVILEPPPVPVPVIKCPRAPEGTPVEKLATAVFQGMPKVGTYEVNNNGLLSLVAGPLPLIVPFPTPTQERIENLNTEVKNPLGQPVEGAYEYDVVVPIGQNSTTDRLRYTPGTGIELVERIYNQDGTVVDFKPLKPIKLVGLTSGEGNSWTDATTDPLTGITMTSEGKVGARERVDMCGTVVEAYRVESTERLVSLNPNSPFASTTRDSDPTTNEGKPNVYYVAPQYGGFFVKVETHTTTTIGALTVNIDNVALKSSLEPAPPG